MARKLYLVRHGTVDANAEKRYIGCRCNPALNNEGRLQAKCLADSLAAYPIQRILCSPLLRTKETAERIAASTGAPLDIDGRLAEVDFGRWDGKTFEEIAAEDPHLVQQWAEYGTTFTFPQGELIAAFLESTANMARALMTRRESSVCAVTHGGTLRAILCHCLGLTYEHQAIFRIEPAGIAVLSIQGKLAQLTELKRC